MKSQETDRALDAAPERGRAVECSSPATGSASSVQIARNYIDGRYGKMTGNRIEQDKYMERLNLLVGFIEQSKPNDSDQPRP